MPQRISTTPSVSAVRLTRRWVLSDSSDIHVVYVHAGFELAEDEMGAQTGEESLKLNRALAPEST